MVLPPWDHGPEGDVANGIPATGAMDARAGERLRRRSGGQAQAGPQFVLLLGQQRGAADAGEIAAVAAVDKGGLDLDEEAAAFDAASGGRAARATADPLEQLPRHQPDDLGADAVGARAGRRRALARRFQVPLSRPRRRGRGHGTRLSPMAAPGSTYMGAPAWPPSPHTFV